MTWCPSEQASAELRCEGKSLQATENERMSLEYLKRKGGQHSSQSRGAVQNGGWRGRGQQGWSWGSSLSAVGSSLTARQFFTRDTVSVGHTNFLFPLVSTQISSPQRGLPWPPY